MSESNENLSDGISDISDVASLFQGDGIEGLNNDELRKCLLILCREGANSDRVSFINIIRGMTINHIQTQKFIDELNGRNKKTEFWFMVLAIGSILIGFLSLAWQVGKDLLCY